MRFSRTTFHDVLKNKTQPAPVPLLSKAEIDRRVWDYEYAFANSALKEVTQLKSGMFGDVIGLYNIVDHTFDGLYSHEGYEQEDDSFILRCRKINMQGMHPEIKIKLSPEIVIIATHNDISYLAPEVVEAGMQKFMHYIFDSSSRQIVLSAIKSQPMSLINAKYTAETNDLLNQSYIWIDGRSITVKDLNIGDVFALYYPQPQAFDMNLIFLKSETLSDTDIKVYYRDSARDGAKLVCGDDRIILLPRVIPSYLIEFFQQGMRHRITKQM